MTTSNLLKQFRRYNIPYEFKTVAKVSFGGSNINYESAVITKDMIQELLNKVMEEGIESYARKQFVQNIKRELGRVK